MPAKVLLVEDDNNLREIYQARLMAEGYTIVTARDGEEALGVAKAEMPDLIISDVMMPRVSGFEMLDILRNTEGLKDVKVIMLTALGQADDKTRANSLGADRYLVKSQVTLEDIVKTSHELLEGSGPAPTAPVATTSDPMAATASPMPGAVAPEPVAAPAMAMPPAQPPTTEAESSAPVEPPAPMQQVATPTAPTAAEEQATITSQIQQFMDSPSAPGVPAPSATAAQDDAVIASAVQDLAASSTPNDENAASAAPAAASAVQAAEPPATDASAPQNDNVTIANKKVIQPLTGDAPKAPIHEILAREEAAGMHSDLGMPPAPATTFSPTAGAAPAAAMEPVIGMPEAPAPAATPSPSDPNNIAL